MHAQTLVRVRELEYDWCSRGVTMRFTAVGKIISFNVGQKMGLTFAQAADELGNIYVLSLGILIKQGELYAKSNMDPIDYCFNCCIGGDMSSPLGGFANISGMRLGNSKYCVIFSPNPGEMFDFITQHNDKLFAFVDEKQVRINRAEYISLVKTCGIVAGLYPINFISQGEPLNG